MFIFVKMKHQDEFVCFFWKHLITIRVLVCNVSIGSLEPFKFEGGSYEFVNVKRKAWILIIRNLLIPRCIHDHMYKEPIHWDSYGESWHYSKALFLPFFCHHFLEKNPRNYEMIGWKQNVFNSSKANLKTSFSVNEM